MGEDLVLYRDLVRQATAWSIATARTAAPTCRTGSSKSAACGATITAGIYDNDGRTLEQPFEDIANPDARYRDKVRITAYPVEEKAGLLWAYLGPQPAPLVPNYEPFLWKNGFAQIVISEVPCNWLQGQENSIDPVHFEWMHRNWSVRLRGETGPYAPRHLKLAFDEFEYGFTYRRVTEDADERRPALDGRPHVSVAERALSPATISSGAFRSTTKNMLSVTWHFARVPKEQEPYEQTHDPDVARPDQGRADR